MEASLASANTSFAERAAKILERVEHRCALTSNDKELVYSTRYIAYKRENLIQPRLDERIYDESYDESPNHWNIMTFLDGEFVSTFRIHVGQGVTAILPSLSTFSDVLGPFVREGRVIVDPTRIAAKLEFAGKVPELPYLTIRAAWLAAEHFRGDIIVSTCIREHEAFYRRVFGFESLCLPRAYPQINRAIVCMALDYRAQKARVETRYPLFRSTESERQKIFGAPTRLSHRKTAVLARIGSPYQ
jgi:hypothetical protein